MELEVYKKSDFYEDYISSQKEYYERENADAYFAEKLAEKGEIIADLQKTNSQLASYCVMLNKLLDTKEEEVNNLLMQNRELCQALQVMYSAEEYTKLQNKNAELKQKLENVQESMYADVVDANMENRRLRRALWIAHAYKAKFKRLWLHLELDYEGSKIRPDTKTIKRIMGKIKNCEKSERKCLKKAKEYK